MEIIIEIVLELLINVFAELLFEVGLTVLKESIRRNGASYPILACIGYALLGCVAGGLSLLVFPRQYMRSERYHGLGLLLIPILAGSVMAGLGAIKSKMGKRVIRLDTFSFGFVFAFFMTLTRFLYAK